MTFVWYSTQYKKLTWEPVKTTDVAVLLHWAVRWRKTCRRDSQQYVKLLKPLGSKPPPLPAGPWLGCASTRPRRWGMQRGPPLSPGNLPHWSPRCCCGSSPAGPRGKTQQSFTGGTQVAPGLVSDLTVYCVTEVLMQQLLSQPLPGFKRDCLLEGGAWNLLWLSPLSKLPSLAWVWRRTHPEAHSRPASTFLLWTRGLPSRGRTCPKEQGKLSWIYIFLLPQI